MAQEPKEILTFEATNHKTFNSDVSAQAVYYAKHLLDIVKSDPFFATLGTKENPINIFSIGIGAAKSELEMLEMFFSDPKLQDKYVVMHGVDPNKGMLDGENGSRINLQKFKDKHHNFDFELHNSTIAEMEFKKELHGKFHLIVSNAAKHHIPDSEFEKSVRAESNLLTTGGYTLGLTATKGFFDNPEKLKRLFNIQPNDKELAQIYGDKNAANYSMQTPIRTLYNVLQETLNLPDYDDGGKEIIANGLFLRFRTKEQYFSEFRRNNLEPDTEKTAIIPLPSFISASGYEGFLNMWVELAAKSICEHYDAIHYLTNEQSKTKKLDGLLHKKDFNLAKKVLLKLQNTSIYNGNGYYKDFIRLFYLARKNEDNSQTMDTFTANRKPKIT